MKIRAVFFTLLLALLLLPAVGDAARLSDEEMELGGIRLGDTMEDVEAVYGEGDHIADGVTKWGGTTVHIFACDYGDSLVVQYRDEGDACRVISVHLGVNNVNKYSQRPSNEAQMIETPSGIHLDSTLEDLEAVYGYIPNAGTMRRPSAAISTIAQTPCSPSTSARSTAPASARSGCMRSGHCAPPLQKPSRSACAFGLTSRGFMVSYTHKRPLCGHCAPPLQKPSQSVCAFWLDLLGFHGTL